MSFEFWELLIDFFVFIQCYVVNFMFFFLKEYSIIGELLSFVNSKDKFQDGEENSCELMVNLFERDLYDFCIFQWYVFYFYSVYRYIFRSGCLVVIIFYDRICIMVDYMFVLFGI